MFGYNPYDAVQRELVSDLWIQQNVPGGLSSPLGRQLDVMMGGNPNPTGGQILGSMGFGSGYGYQRPYGFF